MALAGVLSRDEDAVICDLAETYGILNYRELPATLLAALVVGLGERSRVKKSLSGAPVDTDIMLLAAAVDRLSMLLWCNTTDGQHGRNRPPSVLEAITGKNKEQRLSGYEDIESLEAAWKNRTGVGHWQQKQ